MAFGLIMSAPQGSSMEKKGTENQKLDHWIDRALWAVLCGVFIYASQQISDLSKNVVELRIALSANTMAVATAKTELDDHELRIRALEGVSRLGKTSHERLKEN